jgi:hypothetical protein
VDAMARVLSDPQLCGFQVQPLYDPACNQLQRELERLFIHAAPDDLVLFYYSGHGKLTMNGLHLCASDTEQDLLDSSSVAISWLRSIIDRSKAAQVVIILDCCYSGDSRGELKGDLSSAMTNQFGQGKGKYVMTSSSAIQPSLELPGDTCSLFTKWMVQGLEGAAADSNGDGIVTIEELFQFIENHMAGEEQRPQRWGFDVTPGDVVIARHARAGATPAPLEPLHPEFYRAVQPLLAQRRIIPFLGPGVYGDGPLSAFALSSAMSALAGLRTEEPYPLATTAEYLELMYNDRPTLLFEFRNMLLERKKQQKPPAVLNLLAAMEPPLLIISATYDDVLEQRLREANKRFVVVAHVLHSNNAEHDGKIVVVRCGGQPPVEMRNTDDLLLDESNELIIYKVMGSPFLNECAELPAGIDTVVVTETDHLTFLGRLENQHTNVPTAFSLPFKQRYPLFLGYSLDVWQYRLVMNVFGKMTKQPYAVRQPTTPIEELCWSGLHAKLIPSDPEAFAQTLQSAGVRR